MRGGTTRSGRHRLGTPGLVHCVRFPRVAQLLETRRRRWVPTLLNPARHSLTGLRRATLPGLPSAAAA